ncbi:type VII secretion target [Streptomyces sp. NRRL S-350]|uniref:type VII secretion target n=1 Tax=Streptomyces sp. NRRL S-350 TaxID=1463902 RepID=UPI0004C08332|nr:type VII secretion target [Streptomyces sp. NRRL S-350]
MPDSVGYTVQPVALDHVTTALDNVATDLASANQAYTAQKLYQSADFGEFGVDQAWAGFDTDWSQELHVTQRALAELAQKMSATSANYRAAETKIAASLTPAQSR